MSNNSESFMDLPFLRNLAAYPERTSRQVEQIFSHALDQTRDNSQSEQLQSLRDLNQTNKEIAKWISEILLSNQRGYNDVSHSERDFYESDFDLANDVNSCAGDLSSAMQSIYGGKLPEWKSMVELWRQIWFNWKRTAVALAVHWWIDYNELSKMFHPDFVEYLYNWYSSQEVSQIQKQNLEEIYSIQRKQSDLLATKRSVWDNESGRLVWINRQFSDLSANMAEINKHLLSWDEIKLLDFWLAAKQQSLWSLISNWIIDQKSLELLIRNQKVDWNMALDLSRIVVKDKKWWLKPLVELDGIMWIMQETRINRKIGNISILQRKKINENLENIDDSINEWFEEVSQQIWIWNKKLDKIDKSLHQLDKSIIDSKIETNENLMKINESMYKIWSFTYGVSFPEERKLIDLVKDFWPEGKKTLLSLYAKWMIDESSRTTLWQLFSPAFFNSLSSKNQNVLDIQNDRKNKIDEIQNQIKSLWNSKLPDIEKKRKQYQNELDGLQQTIMSKEDLEYRDIYQKASEANGINGLIEWNFLDDDVLELLVRNQKVDWHTSIDLARIMKIDENGVNPKLLLDGDVWRWQQDYAQTIQWNMLLRQWWVTINEIINVNKNLWIIWNGIQRTNWGIDQMNSNLLAVGENIGDKIMQTNEFLYGLIESNEETNALLEQNNYLMEESNFLNKVTNHLIVGLTEQIAITWAEIVNVLNDIWNLFVLWINKIVNSIDGINETNKWILQELYKQSETLKSIDDKLAKPLDTQANEFFLYGMEILGVWENPSKEDWKAALQSFESWLKLRNTHLYNLYWAATALKNLWKDKESVAYLHRAYKIASKKLDIYQSKNIALDLAKLYMKNFKMDIAKYWLDQVIINDNDCIEAYLLKARITNSLNQKEEFRVLINIIYGKIIQEEEKEFLVWADYEDVLKMIYKPISSLVDKNIQDWLSNKLIKLLPKLQKIWHAEVSRKIIEYVLFKCPQKLINWWVDVKSIISQNKEYFSDLYSKYLENNFKAWNSNDFFALAFIWYKVIDFDILDNLINLWLEYDVDYIRLKNNSSYGEKQIYKTNIQNKIYALWEQGKYIWRDYLRNNPNKFE